MINLKTSELIPKVYNELLKDVIKHGHTDYILPGGRGSCKSSVLSLLIPILIINNPDYNALIVRKVSNTIKDSVYKQILWSLNKLGVSHLFRCLKSPLQIEYIPTGQTIYFRGADNPIKIKSIKTTRGYIALLWLEEWSEFTPYDTETIKLSTMRGGSVFYNFFSYNPPSSLRSWVNTEILKNKKNRMIFKTNYLDVPPEWLGDAFIHEAEQMQEFNPRAYDNIFLGLPTGTGKNIFENLELRPITEEEIDGFEWIYSGMDFGYFPDPFRFVVFSYDMEKRIIYIFRELDLLKHTNYRASEKLKEYFQIKGLDEGLRITGDSANGKDIADFREYGWNIRGAVKGQGSLDNGFKWLQGLTKIVCDPEECPKTADELSNYEYEIDKRTGEIMSGYPQNQQDHSLACLRYGSEAIWRQRGE